MVLVFAGRLEKTAARIESINEVFKNQFILHSERIEPKILSVSAPLCRAEEQLEKDAMEVLHLGRNDFWKMAKERMDLALYFHVDGGLLMSIFEPVSFGVPAIVKDAPWSRSVFGDRYPFYADNETQAYGLVNMFLNDYAGMYAQFVQWFEAWFVPEYTRRSSEDNLFDNVSQSVLAPQVPSNIDGLKKNRIVQLLLEHGGKEFKMFEVLERLSKTHLKSLGVKLSEDFDVGHLRAPD
jgi:hypothetical protein